MVMIINRDRFSDRNVNPEIGNYPELRLLLPIDKVIVQGIHHGNCQEINQLQQMQNLNLKGNSGPNGKSVEQKKINLNSSQNEFAGMIPEVKDRENPINSLAEKAGQNLELKEGRNLTKITDQD